MALDWQAESVMRAAEFYSDRAGYSLGRIHIEAYLNENFGKFKGLRRN
jgi:hypothetical protein